MKIDILDDYIRTPEWFRGFPGPPPPRGFNGPTWALVEKRRGGQGRPHAPSPSSLNWTRRGGGAPLSFFSSSSFPHLLIQRGREGVLLPVGVGLLLARPSPSRQPFPLAPL